MPVQQTKTSQFKEIEEDPLKLLEHDVSYKGWERGLALEKCFYIRGITWFQSEILEPARMPITQCADYIPQMKKILLSRQQWHNRGFDWKQKYAGRQFIDAASSVRRATCQFQKAVEGIVLCEAIAQEVRVGGSSLPPANSVYENMRIEPAASYVNGFTRDLLAELLRDPNFEDALRAATGQTRFSVFHDMAGGATVTHKLAHSVYQFLKKRVNGGRIDPAEFKYEPSRRTYSPSKDEDFDVRPRTLPR